MGHKWMEHAEEELTRQYNDGEISLAEYNAEARELQRDYQEMARESAQDAYEEEMSRW